MAFSGSPMFSFSSNPLSLSKFPHNIESSYKEITDKFCQIYYDYYDTDFLKIKDMCADNTYFTYLDSEVVGFEKLLDIIKSKDVNRFKHEDLNITSQPIGQKSLIINVTGTIYVNNNNNKYKFTETIILKKSGTRYYIQNIIFKVIIKID